MTRAVIDRYLIDLELSPRSCRVSLMNRLTTLCFLLVIVCGNTVAQAPLPPDCSTPPDRQWLPISGTSSRCSGRHPIAGATVTFRDWGYNTMDSSMHLYNLGVLRSKITTGPDGTFSFPVQCGRSICRASFSPRISWSIRGPVCENRRTARLIVSTRRTSRCSEAIQQATCGFPAIPYMSSLCLSPALRKSWASPS